jgi:hypothetical protein
MPLGEFLGYGLANRKACKYRRQHNTKRHKCTIIPAVTVLTATTVKITIF